MRAPLGIESPACKGIEGIRTPLPNPPPVRWWATSAALVVRPCASLRAPQAQGLFEDPHILHVGEVELFDMRLADDDPLVVAQFVCQQIKCVRDK